MNHSCCRRWKLFLVLLLSLSVCIQSETRISATKKHGATSTTLQGVLPIRGGWSIIPSGYNPFGYKITELGKRFLNFGDSLECDVGRFLASLKAHRKRRKEIKDQWLEIVRASKKGQNMRIYRELDNLLDFCLQAGLIN
mmetsp:Transcript_20889/g.37937  ORF Transcript_20889/g.37937 Transcript_20889/m.37937 type:complete len:139 (+) Transcript_20889:51-467(+)